ncbi:MAG: hypothetical protein QXT98_07600 [Archaeoglobaceae archaeon]
MNQKNDLLKDISDKLDKIIKLLAFDIAKGIEKEQDKIELLDSLGFRPVDIAKLLNKNLNVITAHLSRIRKKRGVGSKAMEQNPELGKEETKFYLKNPVKKIRQ